MRSVLEGLKARLIHPAARGIDIDAPDSNLIFSRILKKNVFLRRIYQQWYSEISDALPLDVEGPVLELGSGAGFFKEHLPGLITSEILRVSSVDIVLDGQYLPFENSSLRGIVMVDVFHHIPGVKLFLAEAERCLKPGGVIVMVEPWCTGWSRFVYRYIHYEPFCPDAENWHFPSGGPLSSANSALPWIVFDRDVNIFKKEFSFLTIESISLHTPFAYLLSRGVTMRSLVPATLFDVCRKFENKFSPLMGSLAMFATIVLKRT